MSIGLDQFFPFDQGAGLNATQPRWRLMARLFYGSGVVPNYLNQFNATLAGGVITIQPGGAWIDGFYGETNGNKTLTVTNGTVVARMDPTGRQIVFALLPTPQQPTQNPTDVYEIPLWVIVGTSLGDVRQFSSSIPGKGARARAYRAAPFTFSNSPIVLDTVQYGTGFSGGVYTCPYGADYDVTGAVGASSSATNQWMISYLNHNGSTWCFGSTVGIGTATVEGYSVAHDIVPCKTGDTIGLSCWGAMASGIPGINRTFLTVRALT